MCANFFAYIVRNCILHIHGLIFSGFQARRQPERMREKETGIGVGRKSEEGPVVKKDFPTIYLHLRAINNSRVRMRARVAPYS